MFLHALLSEMAKKVTEPDNAIIALTVSNDTEDGDDEVDGSAMSQSNMLKKVAKRTYDKLSIASYSIYVTVLHCVYIGDATTLQTAILGADKLNLKLN